MKKVLCTGLCTLAIALLASTALAQAPLKIGVNFELSGRIASLANNIFDGIKVQQQLKGDLLGRKVEFSVCDDNSTPEGSVACANRFVDEGVVAVLGPTASSMAIPAAQVLQKAGIVMISPSSTNPATTQTGDYIFRIAFNDQFQGEVAADYLYNKLGARNVAVFRQQDDDYSVGLAKYFQDAFKALGGTTQVVDYTAGTVDFAAQINDVRMFNPDTFYLAGFCSELASLVPQLRQQGFAEQKLFGGDSLDDPQCPEGGGEAFNGFQFTAYAEPSQLSADPEAAKRAEEFQTEYKKLNPDGDFNGFTLAGADAYGVLAEAITQAGTDDASAIRDALGELENYPGVTGAITYKGTDGTPANRILGSFEYHVPGENGEAWSKSAGEGLTLSAGE